MKIYHRYMIDHDLLTDEQARLVSKISSRLPPQDSMQFLAGISDCVRQRSGITDVELYQLISHEMALLGIETTVVEHAPTKH